MISIYRSVGRIQVKDRAQHKSQTCMSEVVLLSYQQIRTWKKKMSSLQISRKRTNPVCAWKQSLQLWWIICPKGERLERKKTHFLCATLVPLTSQSSSTVGDNSPRPVCTYAPPGRPHPGSRCLIIHAVGGGGTEILFGPYLDIYCLTECSIAMKKQDPKHSTTNQFLCSLPIFPPSTVEIHPCDQVHDQTFQCQKSYIRPEVLGWNLLHRIREGKNKCLAEPKVIWGLFNL